MIYMTILFAIFAFGIFSVLVTQVVVPFVRGTQYFPMLRKSEVQEKVAEAEHALETVSEIERLQTLSDQLAARAAKLNKE